MQSDIVKLTPKRVAELIVYNWFSGGGVWPWRMSAEDMSFLTEEFGYKVTENRREKILEQVEKIIGPMRDRLGEKVQEFAHV